MSWWRNARARQDILRAPEVKCSRCGYHYRTSSMVAEFDGWLCADVTRCNRNLADRAHHKRRTR
jgi:hypothetical protein